MTPEELKSKLAEMMALPTETEWIEFKEAKNDYHFDELGQYFSALSNEANLMGQKRATRQGALISDSSCPPWNPGNMEWGSLRAHLRAPGPALPTGDRADQTADSF